MVNDTDRMSGEELRSIAKTLGLPFLEEISDDAFAPELTAKLPVAWARAQCVLPVILDGRPPFCPRIPRTLRPSNGPR